MNPLLVTLSKMDTPRKIALFRVELLSAGDTGLAGRFFDWLQQAWNEFSSSKILKCELLLQILQIYLQLARLDQALAEELAFEGAHTILIKIMNLDNADEDDPTMCLLQEAACEIATRSTTFPIRVRRVSLSRNELIARLPLVFEYETNNTSNDCCKILIHQVVDRQSAQKDVGFVLWPAAVVLSQWLTRNASVLDGTVLELGAGCGLVGLVAGRLIQAKGNNSRVLLTDFNRVVLDNLSLNIRLNDLQDCCESVGLDFYMKSIDGTGWVDLDGTTRTQVDVVLAADMICQPSDAASAANCIFDCLVPGGSAFIVLGDSTHRFGVEFFRDACCEAGLEISEEIAIASGDLLQYGSVTDLEKTSGYVDGLALKMFKLKKPTGR
jgi:predicted nicotinamide N-methyase